ncbi:hypothetical protein [Agromyces mariniharenae]|uniref:Uncharacterized protein n=1 Tax=Agromyces mariniharenae TaxID=2604423 RepID=A0A5S4VAU9_9MICO|nr:hypothetical protein [Agromyces mariniharenae]TYL51185.1 hypothetical protein FYC51_18895 [Agromyces mariniharenae]
MPTRISRLLRGLLLLSIARLLLPGTSSAAPTEVAEPTVVPRFPILRLGIAICGLIALLLSGTWLFARYDETLPTIGDPPPTGSIYLYFDRPDVTASLHVEVTSEPESHEEGDYASDSYVINVTAENFDPNDPPRFYVALGGSALPQDVFPDASDRESSANDCLTIVVSLAPEFDCVLTRGSPESAYASDELKEDLIVVSGLLQPIGVNEGLAWIDLTANADTLVGAGDTEVFQLPTVGTTYIPETVGDEMNIIIDDVGPLYVPDPITPVVEYQWLSPTDQLESLSVEPVARQPLTWVENYRTMLTASGMITDTRDQRDADRSGFFWGVLAGILGGFVVPVIGLWRETIAAFWRWQTSRRTALRTSQEGSA